MASVLTHGHKLVIDRVFSIEAVSHKYGIRFRFRRRMWLTTKFLREKGLYEKLKQVLQRVLKT